MASYRPPSARRSTVSVSSTSSGILASDGPILTPLHERRPQAAEDPQPRHRDVAAERIRHQIDLMPERGQRADAMKLAEGRAPRLEKRLGGDHQNAHGRVIFARNRSRVRLPVSAGCPPNLLPQHRIRCIPAGATRSSRSSSRSALILLWILFSRIDVGKLWASARTASVPWLVAALAIYATSVAASVWRWHLLLDAQDVHVATNTPGRLVPGGALLQ